MKKDVMVAITFAENGEFETARLYTPDIPKSTLLEWVQKHFVAVTFAEADMPDEARTIMESGDREITKEELFDLLGIDVNNLISV